jgi:hypothetical protein
MVVLKVDALWVFTPFGADCTLGINSGPRGNEASSNWLESGQPDVIYTRKRKRGLTGGRGVSFLESVLTCEKSCVLKLGKFKMALRELSVTSMRVTDAAWWVCSSQRATRSTEGRVASVFTVQMYTRQATRHLSWLALMLFRDNVGLSALHYTTLHYTTRSYNSIGRLQSTRCYNSEGHLLTTRRYKICSSLEPRGSLLASK